MNTELPMYEWNTWNQINWKKVESQVFKLQKRIYKASQCGDTQKVHKLQRLLTASFYGKALAVRKVTQDNQGKKTAGVDGVKSLNPVERFRLVNKLRIGSKCDPTRRVWIPKANGDKRPLGIPTIKDRAIQCLAKFALEPEWEAKFEENSYGFRPGRSCHDAIEAIQKSITRTPKYVLDADISKCFDKINHEKLLTKVNTYPKLRKQIKAFLKAGFMDRKEWFPTEAGTPQGGIISPLLANIALHGLETMVKDYCENFNPFDYRVGRKYRRNAVSIIRYADDFVILYKDLTTLKECQRLVSEWLKNIGLELNTKKTRIGHTLKSVDGIVGLDFLGFSIRQNHIGKHNAGKDGKGKLLGHKTLIKPSKKSVEKHMLKIREIIQSHRHVAPSTLVVKLVPVIKGWTNYFSSVCSKSTFSNIDNKMYQKLRGWVKRNNPKLTNGQAYNKYFRFNGNYGFGERKGETVYKLPLHAETPIIRHTKVQGHRSIYDGDFKYWGSRLGKYPGQPKRITKLLKKQRGKCNHCGLTFVGGELIEVDHITPKACGGKDTYDNLQLLHRHCHDTKTLQDMIMINTGVKENDLVEEEPSEVESLTLGFEVEVE